MNMSEYLKVKDFTYLEYCDYLQNKYGISIDDYMTPKFNKKNTCTRTSEGLFAHHKDEDKAILLSRKEFAMKWPYEWQLKDHIVYCDYLEHLLLHVLICEYPNNMDEQETVGIGGVLEFIIPTLNDVYSGWEPKATWHSICCNKVKDDEDVYLAIIERLLKTKIEGNFLSPHILLRSAAYEKGSGWTRYGNHLVYSHIFRSCLDIDSEEYWNHMDKSAIEKDAILFEAIYNFHKHSKDGYEKAISLFEQIPKWRNSAEGLKTAKNELEKHSH